MSVLQQNCNGKLNLPIFFKKPGLLALVMYHQTNGMNNLVRRL